MRRLLGFWNLELYIVICHRASLVGSRWGRHPLAKVNSPKKTWEGTAGGMLAVLLMAWIFELFILPATVTLFEALSVAFVIAAVSVASDISESLLKRCAGVKDSSPLLPGHGGILDRFDAIILTAPLFYYYWAIFRKF
jgi:phosphatidate cytidylyltransferase